MRILTAIMLCMLCGMQAVAQNVEKEFPGEDAQVYLEPDVLPVFPGGTEELMKYLRENVKYPHVCQQQGIQGRVIVQFVVNADGSIDDATVVKPVNVPKALVEHFAYSPEIRHVHRFQHTDEEWNRLMTDELAAHRPIYYSTRSTKHDGHAFVICGIDEQGLYYVNWGWRGQCDGYFDFDCVANSNAAYNYVQSAIIGIEPER